MLGFRRIILMALACLAALATPVAAQRTEQPGLTAFSSDAAMRDFLRAIVAEQQEEWRRNPPPPPPPPAPPPPPPPPGAAAAPASVSITNNQIQGVDEGDIVKLRGETLVILRRGRLYTVSIAGGAMRPIMGINAFPPGIDGRGDWYDEMLIAGDMVAVIGFSYARGGTQLNRFRLDAEGRLTFVDAHQLRSGDYYSSRNYASRLLGNQLILYAPLYLRFQGDPLDSLPALRRWDPNAPDGGAFRRIANGTNVYVPQRMRNWRQANITTLHSVTRCDLSAAVLDCDATVVMGSPSRTFFVSNNAVYLWSANVWKNERPGANSIVYRLPFDGSRPAAVMARGNPVDQFSFLPDAARGALQIVVRAYGRGDAMWAPEMTDGAVALLSVPMGAFGNGNEEVPLNRYHRLPTPAGNSWQFQNRYVGDHLLYGTASEGREGQITVVSLADRQVSQLATAHGIDRIDQIGPDSILIGSGPGALGFTAIELGGSAPRIGATFSLPDAREGDSRSHGFYFRPDAGSRDGSGVLGLPVARQINREGTSPFNSAGLLFLNRRGGQMSQAGELNAADDAARATNDGCVASCVDWYGNARPIFIGDRVFALLGYELVEGATRDGQIRERARTSFFQPPMPAAR